MTNNRTRRTTAPGTGSLRSPEPSAGKEEQPNAREGGHPADLIKAAEPQVVCKNWLEEYKLQNYFLFMSIILLLDSIYVKLFEIYLEKAK